MDKQILNFTVNEQALTVDEPIKISTNKVNYIQANFDLGQNWQGYDSIRAIWFNDFQTISTVLDSLGTCAVPFEVMKRKGCVKVNLVGSISEDDVLTDRLTSYPVVAVIVDCTAQITGANTSPITPSEFELFAQRVHTDAERAEAGATASEQSAQNAHASEQNASNSAESAHDDKVAIEEAIAEVIQQIEDFEQVQVVVNTLPPSSQATSDFTDGVLTLGIPQGVKGDTGNGIQSITKVSTSGLVDTYRITYTNGQTTTFTVTNGAKGDTGNGISTIEKTSTVGLVDTYTITYTDGTTTTFTVTNGEKGDKGDTGEVSLSELEQATVVQTLSDNTPYNYRRTNNGNGAGHREYDEIVGASVGWNQLASDDVAEYETYNTTISKSGNVITITSTTDASNQKYAKITSSTLNHVYCIGGSAKTDGTALSARIGLYDSVGTYVGGFSATSNTWASGFSVVKATTSGYIALRIPNGSAAGVSCDYEDVQVIDLTLLNSAIADYIYSLEQATAGSGVAWLKNHFPNLFGSYQPYDAGSIKSVSGLTAHVMRDSSDNIIGSYPLDSSVTLRGQYKLDGNNQLYAGGDVWKSAGQADRNCIEIDLGDLDWRRNGETSPAQFYGTLTTRAIGNNAGENIVCSKYAGGRGYDGNVDKVICVRSSYAWIIDDAYSDGESLKASLSGAKLVYPIETPTTETAPTYDSPQWCDSKGTEEYVGSELPVGHNTDYPMTMVDCADGLGDGTYEAKLTIANGVKTFTWQSV